MYVQRIDTTDPAALEAALEAAPLGTPAHIEPADGEHLTVTRVPGGWYLPGDVAVASRDVADGRPRAVSLLRDAAYGGEEGWLVLADQDPDEARGVAAWAEAQREYLPPEWAIEEARARF